MSDMANKDVVAQLRALERHLGISRSRCHIDMCTEGQWPDGGKCHECNGLGYRLEEFND